MIDTTAQTESLARAQSAGTAAGRGNTADSKNVGAAFRAADDQFDRDTAEHNVFVAAYVDAQRRPYRESAPTG